MLLDADDQDVPPGLDGVAVTGVAVYPSFEGPGTFFDRIGIEPQEDFRGHLILARRFQRSDPSSGGINVSSRHLDPANGAVQLPRKHLGFKTFDLDISILDLLNSSPNITHFGPKVISNSSRPASTILNARSIVTNVL